MEEAEENMWLDFCCTWNSDWITISGFAVVGPIAGSNYDIEGYNLLDIYLQTNKNYVFCFVLLVFFVFFCIY